MAVKKIENNRLESEGKEYRSKSIPGKNRYADEINPYDGDNQDALHHDDDKHPWGKGTGKSMGYAIKKDTPKGIFGYQNHDYEYGNVDTKNGGGSYDIYGTEGVDKAYQGKSGRNYLQQINIYGPEKEYGKDSVDIDNTIRGQFVN